MQNHRAYSMRIEIRQSFVFFSNGVNSKEIHYTESYSLVVLRRSSPYRLTASLNVDYETKPTNVQPYGQRCPSTYNKMML